ncbi:MULTISPECIES: TIGR02281 family clan AA aspartic protease [Alphaproteobacteria]|uniref:Aspartyl protease n=2 Tax=Alphaproteobacteria TaxID=28211 RepID=A0A512HP46_9HYPH|nr:MULTISPECIES: TIGR02281 family clan AA aspartic protease [Alphaproteobacteria]GEO87222.1 aspartyl protease [Ciceribacter naphthalenivorans]GLR23048.1 aspartyl protease [Ciceribacter naphthalenivorans]GLT05904.1 aspartyl protease [Sphingomonas psychrolutea]
MLMRTLAFVIVAGVLATQVPGLFEALDQPAAQGGDGGTPNLTKITATPSGTTVLKADTTGHFRGTFKLNGKPVEALVDTGASLVAINETTARRIGVSLASLDFKYPIATANGQTQAAHVRLQRVEIGSIKVDAVDAFVLRDKALSGTLIGMSFLKRLGAYSAQDGQLRLVR